MAPPWSLPALCAAALLPRVAGKCTEAWDYRDTRSWGFGKHGSTQWMCGHAGDQSPVDVARDEVRHDSALGPLEIGGPRPRESEATLLLNEHTWQVDMPRAGATVAWGGLDYELTQFHFHAPSEHTVDGRHAEMEMHLVNTNPQTGRILVVALLAKLGTEPNPYFSGFWSQFPPVDGGRPLRIADPYANVMPKDRSYYHYLGSLTTPPCTNDTTWILMRTPIYISYGQLVRYRADISAPKCNQLSFREAKPWGVYNAWDTSLGTNNRPTQPLAGRVVSEFVPWGEGRRGSTTRVITMVVALAATLGVVGYTACGRRKRKAAQARDYMPLQG